MRATTIALALTCSLVAACSGQAANEPAANLSEPAAAQQPAEHDIAIREGEAGPEFYHVGTGETFVPRGTNYVRLAEQQMAGGGSVMYHSTLNPGRYDPEETGAAFEAMAANGYNVARVFLNGCCAEGIGSASGSGLDPDYLDNLVDMLRRAQDAGIYVMLTADDVPKLGGYFEMLNEDCCAQFEHTNLHYLAESGLRAHRRFWTDLLTGLIERDAPLDAIWAYALFNEAYFRDDHPPLSRNAGEVTTANGNTYDLSSDADREAMLGDNLLHFIAATRETIRAHDPTALVTIGFFWPKQPNPARDGDPRVVRTARVIAESEADFVDLHPYPGVGLTFEQMMENFGVEPGNSHLLVAGEIGADTKGHPSPADAARVLQEWQVASCEYGFDGWLTWTWDTAEQPEFYEESSGDGQIREAMSPKHRRDPCEFGDDFRADLTAGAAVTASAELEHEPAQAAVDGDGSTWWGAGAPAAQWIRIDLAEAAAVGEVRLQVSQSPAGETTHVVTATTSTGITRTLAELSGPTADQEWLTVPVDPAVEDVVAIRIETVDSPSWVAWREIEIYGG